MITTDNHLVSINTEGALEAEMLQLARLISIHAPYDGGFSLSIPGLYVGRDSKIDTDSVKTFYLPSMGIAAQGSKSIMVGREIYHYDGAQMHLIPIALPVALRTTQASTAEPFLGIRLDLDPKRIAELVLKVYPQGLPTVRKWSASYVTRADVRIVNAMRRMLECLQNSGDTELLVPLIKDEILIRLLRSPIGIQVAEMGLVDSEVHPVAKAIDWLRDNYSQPMKIADLADSAHMSVSSFHAHFKSVTSMSPLQYQKVLRLHEARRLMLSRHMDATSACQLVGYLSASQFNRDYSSYFGSPPKRDIAKLRQQTQVPDISNE